MDSSLESQPMIDAEHLRLLRLRHFIGAGTAGYAIRRDLHWVTNAG